MKEQTHLEPVSDMAKSYGDQARAIMKAHVDWCGTRPELKGRPAPAQAQPQKGMLAKAVSAIGSMLKAFGADPAPAAGPAVWKSGHSGGSLEKATAELADLTKAHVDTFTKQDGTVVQAHETKVTAHAGAVVDKPHPDKGFAVGANVYHPHPDKPGKQGLGKYLGHTEDGSKSVIQHDTTGKKYAVAHEDVKGARGLPGGSVKAAKPAAKPAEPAKPAVPRETGEAKPDGGGEASKASLVSVAEKHRDKFESKAESWSDQHHAGIPASELAGAPRFSHKEVYGSEKGSSPAATDFHPDFKDKAPQHFVLQHKDGKEHFVNTEGYDYARYHAPVKPAESAQPAAETGPAEGEVGHEEHKNYGVYFKKGDKVRHNAQGSKPETVLGHHGPVVYTDKGNTYHPTKLVRHKEDGDMAKSHPHVLFLAPAKA